MAGDPIESKPTSTSRDVPVIRELRLLYPCGSCFTCGILISGAPLTGTEGLAVISTHGISITGATSAFSSLSSCVARTCMYEKLGVCEDVAKL